MPAQKTVWTAEMARALPDDEKRYEVLDGALFVSPAPSAVHQRAVGRLFVILDDYCRRYHIGEAMMSPADIEFSEHRLLQPDVFVTPLIEGRRIKSWNEVKTLLLAAEVLSPSTAHADRFNKRFILQDVRVPDYWTIDLDARAFERWQPDDDRPAILGEWLEWHPITAVPSLRIDLAEYFRSVLD